MKISIKCLNLLFDYRCCTGCLHLENVQPLFHTLPPPTDQTKQDRDLKFGVDLKQVTTLGLIEAIFDN